MSRGHIIALVILALVVRRQCRIEDDNIVETRTSPPWFTEEEILQAVEGARE